MRDNATVAVVIPALNEERAIGKVLAAIPSWVDTVIVGDNGSTDSTADIARRHGAQVVFEPRRGYGSACLKAMAALDAPDVLVFLDGDFSDHPEEMHSLVDPIVQGEADLVIGSRVRGRRDPGALPLQARFGNWLACALLRWFWGVRYTDLGPFRAIRYSSLQRLAMGDPDYGWTVEMQIKAALYKLRPLEIPVSYRPRIGDSKVTGTLRGIVGASTKIIHTILVSAWQRRRRQVVASQDRRLIVFTRYPEPGKVKTRLIPALGEAGAAELCRDMTAYTLSCMDELQRWPPIPIEVRFDGGNECLMRRAFGPRLRYTPQGTGDLGARMSRAFGSAFRDGARAVVIVGTDCPGLTSELVRNAFELLETTDLVLGPAYDGGYYLIGLRHPAAHLFTDIPWGSETVLQDTLRRAEDSLSSYKLLRTLHDVDRPDDLATWHGIVGASRSSASAGT